MDVRYELQNSNGDWLDDDQGQNGELVAPSGGIYGFAVEIPNNPNTHIAYQGYTGGQWSAVTKNGDRVTENKPITAIRIAISPRRTRHVSYTTFSTKGTVETKYEEEDNAIAGNANDTLTKIRIKILG